MTRGVDTGRPSAVHITAAVCFRNIHVGDQPLERLQVGVEPRGFAAAGPLVCRADKDDKCHNTASRSTLFFLKPELLPTLTMTNRFIFIKLPLEWIGLLEPPLLT